MPNPFVEQISITITEDGVTTFCSPGCLVSSAHAKSMTIKVQGIVIVIAQESDQTNDSSGLQMLVPGRGRQ